VDATSSHPDSCLDFVQASELRKLAPQAYRLQLSEMAVLQIVIVTALALLHSVAGEFPAMFLLLPSATRATCSSGYVNTG
jgi:hypothetical protein